MITIQWVVANSSNRRKFRTIARETCGYSMEPTDGEQICFGFVPQTYPGKLCAVASIKTASSATTSETENQYFHWLTFLFVHRDYQGTGFGSHLLNSVESHCWNILKRPLRIEAARKAVTFFERNGYHKVGDTFECIHSGSPLFRFLQIMEKQFDEEADEVW